MEAGTWKLEPITKRSASCSNTKVLALELIFPNSLYTFKSGNGLPYIYSRLKKMLSTQIRVSQNSKPLLGTWKVNAPKKICYLFNHMTCSSDKEFESSPNVT